MRHDGASQVRAHRLTGMRPVPDVSLPSAGRNTSMLGMARRLASVSTGWWVGPSCSTTEHKGTDTPAQETR